MHAKPSPQKSFKMKNPKFNPINFDAQSGNFTNLHLLADVANLLYSNRFELFDSFFQLNEENKIQKTIELVQHTAPAFWAITNPQNGELAGVAYLYDWIGSSEKCYSVKVSTCFARKYWGGFTHRAGKLFLRYIFAKYAPTRLCAEVYASNPYPKRLLEKLGFHYEFTKPNATLSKGRPVSVLGYSAENPRTQNPGKTAKTATSSN